MKLFDLFAQEYRTKRINHKDPLVALNELIDFKPLVDVVEAIAPRKQSEKGGITCVSYRNHVACHYS
jgi:hypothetical protein